MIITFSMTIPDGPSAVFEGIEPERVDDVIRGLAQRMALASPHYEDIYDPITNATIEEVKQIMLDAFYTKVEIDI